MPVPSERPQVTRPRSGQCSIRKLPSTPLSLLPRRISLCILDVEEWVGLVYLKLGAWGVCVCTCAYVRACVGGCGVRSPLSEVQLFLGNVCLALREHDQP